MPKVAYATTNNIVEHVKLIHDQARKSLRDPELRQLAVKIVSGRFQTIANPRTGKPEEIIKAWGKNFIAPPGDMCAPRDATCEVVKVWNFVVLNCRYVYDNVTTDVFATAKETLLAGGGDCDDLDIVFLALLDTLGFQTKSRVISQAETPNEWCHIYPLVGIEKDNPTQWMPLDTTVTGYGPGSEWPDIGRIKDFNFSG